MKIFNWLNRSGKIALSAMQAVGLTAVVGVAGVAAWQYVNAPSDNASFNPAQYNPGEVVYVAGANTGGYMGGSYSGQTDGSIQVSAKTLKRMDQQYQAEQVALEMEEEAAQLRASAAAPTGPAYQMGATEGLGMGANAANEELLKNNPLASMQQTMSGVQNIVANAQAQAQSAQEQAQAAKEGSLASVRPDWSGKAGSGGGSQGSSNVFAVQNSGKNKGGSAAGGNSANPQDIIASAQAQAAGMLEGTRLRSRSSFGRTDGLADAGRDASVMGGRQGNKDKNDLEFIRKRSADAAKNRYRAANEGSRAFLASTQISGGMRIEADNVTTGQSQGSKDFNNDYDTNLRGIRNWGDIQMDLGEDRQNDYNNLLVFWITTVAAVIAGCIGLFYLAKAAMAAVVPWVVAALWIAFGILAAGLITMCGFLIAHAADYASKWGGGWFSTWAGITGIVGIAAVGVSAFVNVSKALKIAKTALEGAGGLTPVTSTPTMTGSGMGGVFEEQTFLDNLLGLIKP